MEALPLEIALAPALEAKVLGFHRLLRRHGFTVGHGESMDALRVARHLLCVDFAAFHSGLRGLLCLSRTQYEDFDALFEGYWCPADATRRIDPERLIPTPREQRGGATLVTTGAAAEPDSPESDHATTGASDAQRLRRQDFSQVAPADQRRLEQLALRLWQRMALRRPRRLRGKQGQRQLHFRRTVRASLAHGGEPLHLHYLGRKPRRPRLVVALDVSGSMELYSFFLLRLLYALQRRFRRVHSFTFATELVEVTHCLASRTLQGALTQVAGRTLGWQGGTRIGDCLLDLVELHGPRLLRPDSVFVILSDGLDVGRPERLGAALRRIRERAGKVVWLNPLLGLPGYQPLAGGMQAALPWVDVFAPAHSVDSLLDLGRYLGK